MARASSTSEPGKRRASQRSAPSSRSSKARSEKLKLAARLSQRGVAARVIAETLDLPLGDVVNAELGKGKRSAVTQGEEEVRDAVRALAERAVERAEYLLYYGAPNTQLSLIRNLLQPLLYNRDTNEGSEKLNAMRERLDELMEDVRSEPKRPLRAVEHSDEVGSDRATSTKLGATRIPRRS